MANGYMPRQDAQALEWMQNFVSRLVAEPARFMASAADAATVQRAVSEYAKALAVSSDPDTRTKPAVEVKNQTRASAEAVCAQFYSLIKANAGISDSDKIDIGVRPLNRGRSKIKCPLSSPELAIVGATPGAHTLRFRDALMLSGGGKPYGAKFLELRVAVAKTAILDVAQARPVGMFTANPINVKFDHEEDQLKATYFGRWVSARGETGDWSLPRAMTIAA